MSSNNIPNAFFSMYATKAKADFVSAEKAGDSASINIILALVHGHYEHALPEGVSIEQWLKVIKTPNAKEQSQHYAEAILYHVFDYEGKAGVKNPEGYTNAFLQHVKHCLPIVTAVIKVREQNPDSDLEDIIKLASNGTMRLLGDIVEYGNDDIAGALVPVKAGARLGSKGVYSIASAISGATKLLRAMDYLPEVVEREAKASPNHSKGGESIPLTSGSIDTVATSPVSRAMVYKAFTMACMHFSDRATLPIEERVALNEALEMAAVIMSEDEFHMYRSGNYEISMATSELVKVA